MHRRLSMHVSLISFAAASMIMVGCTVNNVHSDCEGASCVGGSSSLVGTATGGASARNTTSTAVGGSSRSSSTQTASAGGTQSSGGSSSSDTSTGGTSAIRTAATGGAPATGGASTTGGARTGGAPATGGSIASGGAHTGGRTAAGGAFSTGGARTGGASSVGSTQTGGTAAVVTSIGTGGLSSVGGNSSTMSNDADGDGVVDGEDLCPNNPAISKPGKVTISVSFTSAAQAYPDYLEGLKASMIASGQEWAKYFPVPHDVSLEVQIDISDIATANGRATDTVLAENLGNITIYQQGTVYEVLTGIDPNGAEPDVEIAFGIDPLTGANGHFYWADPDPVLRTATMPNNAVDTVSTCLHELGHAFGFNGWRDWATGALPGDYGSYYDYLSSTDGTDFFFEGTRAVAKYGKKVPETYGNIAHIGNYNNGHPGEDLDLDLMRGTRTLLAHRYYISALDVAVLADVGLPIPGTDAAKALCNGTSTAEPGVIELGPPPPAIE